jgi:hypothetical protein
MAVAIAELANSGAAGGGEGGKSGGSSMTCSFGTISGLASRIVESVVEGNGDGGVSVARPVCIAPAHGRRDAVPVRVTWRSLAWHEYDTVGEFDFIPSPPPGLFDGVGGAGDVSSDGSGTSGVTSGTAALTALVPGVVDSGGGSVVTLAIARDAGIGGSDQPGYGGLYCVFIADLGSLVGLWRL